MTSWKDWVGSWGLHALVGGVITLFTFAGFDNVEPPQRLDVALRWAELPTEPARTVPTTPTTSPPPQARSIPRKPHPVQPLPTPSLIQEVPTSTAQAQVPVSTTTTTTSSPVASLSSPTATTTSPSTPTPTPITDPATEQRWQDQLEALLARDRHYPMQARRAGQEGTVTVEAHFAADGQLLRCAVQIGSGFRALDEAAVLMVRRAAEAARALINPGRSAQLRIPITFHLEES